MDLFKEYFAYSSTMKEKEFFHNVAHVVALQTHIESSFDVRSLALQMERWLGTVGREKNRVQ